MGSGPRRAPGGHAVEMERQTAAAGPTVAGHVFESQSAAAVNALVRHESLHGAGQFKVVAGAILGRVRRLLRQCSAYVNHMKALRHCVGYCPTPIGSWQVEPV